MWLEGVTEFEGVGWCVADGWKVSRRVSGGVLLIVHDRYVVVKCCTGRNWFCVLVRIFCSVIVNVTFAAETRGIWVNG